MAADQCLDLAEKTKSAKYLARARRARGLAQLGQGRLAEADAEIEASLAIAREVGNPPQLWRTLAALGELRAAQGRSEEARAASGEAAAVIDTVAAGLGDALLHRIFLDSEHVRGIRLAAEGQNLGRA